MKEPEVQVGILSGTRIEFILSTLYRYTATYCDGVVTRCGITRGPQLVSYSDGKILWDNRPYDELLFEPLDQPTDAPTSPDIPSDASPSDDDASPAASFELLNVTIGINFHWERKENQRFRGSLKIIVEDLNLTAINIIRVEDYLTSVISSEMSATASPELLKAHAVISRSWLLAQIEKNKETAKAPTVPPAFTQTDEELIRWYDRQDHTRFDVCADDHCQRYQGITRASTRQAAEAVSATRGQVLTYHGKICDARFSKCCGGILEEFQYCWEDVKHPYLTGKRDWIDERVESSKLKVQSSMQSDSAANYQLSTINYQLLTEAFCNTQDKRILSQVLNNYDQETTDFYRWKVTYTRDELSALIKERSGIDFGCIIDLVPIARGTSGRIWKLKIVGTKKSLIIGKELEIRRTLSPTHLYSSAFVVDKEGDRFILTGAGWGHGVGLCQIGAAVMGEQGYTYDAILLHYYTGASIDKLYT